MAKRILITGGSGLLALNWALFDRNKHEVILALHNREILLSGTRTVKVNTDSIEDILRSIDEIQPDLIVNTAGLTSVEECERNPKLAKLVNTDIASDISRVCSAFNMLMVHISTDHIFPGDSEMADELAPVCPKNVYGKTKAEAEIKILDNCPSALIVRTNFYGWGPSYRRSFSDKIIYSLRKGEKITLFNDVYYTPILAEPLIKTVHELIEYNAFGIYNVVGDDRISKYEFGISIAEHFGLNNSLINKGKVVDKPELVLRPKDMSLSNKKAVLKINHPLGGINQHLTKLFEQEKSGFINEILKL